VESNLRSLRGSFFHNYKKYSGFRELISIVFNPFSAEIYVGSIEEYQQFLYISFLFLQILQNFNKTKVNRISNPLVAVLVPAIVFVVVVVKIEDVNVSSGRVVADVSSIEVLIEKFVLTLAVLFIVSLP